MTNVVTFTGSPLTLERKPPAGKLGARDEPCPIVSVSNMQGTQLRLLSEMVTTTFKSLLLSNPHDQAEETIQNAVDIGIAKAMRCENE